MTEQELQAVCDRMDEEGKVILPETLAEEAGISLEEATKFIEDNCNGYQP